MTAWPRPIDQIVDELIQLTGNWNEHDDVPIEASGRARQLGQRLHDLGGMRMMEAAYERVTRVNRFANALRYDWHGIGKWKA